jgi:mRNA interferase YafQ
MEYTLVFSKKFEKDAKLCKKRDYDISLIQTVFEILKTYGEVPKSYKPHKLSGNYANHWELPH